VAMFALSTLPSPFSASTVVSSLQGGCKSSKASEMQRQHRGHVGLEHLAQPVQGKHSRLVPAGGRVRVSRASQRRQLVSAPWLCWP
jgi:hypothetical protein